MGVASYISMLIFIIITFPLPFYESLSQEYALCSFERNDNIFPAASLVLSAWRFVLIQSSFKESSAYLWTNSGVGRVSW